jgi:hypothetical protein
VVQLHAVGRARHDIPNLPTCKRHEDERDHEDGDQYASGQDIVPISAEKDPHNPGGGEEKDQAGDYDQGVERLPSHRGVEATLACRQCLGFRIIATSIGQQRKTGETSSPVALCSRLVSWMPRF